MTSNNCTLLAPLIMRERERERERQGKKKKSVCVRVCMCAQRQRWINGIEFHIGTPLVFIQGVALITLGKVQKFPDYYFTKAFSLVQI